jgi:hypothetical protein
MGNMVYYINLISFTNSVVTVIPDSIDLFSEENILSRKLVTSEIFSQRKP